MIPYGRQSISESDIKAVVKVLQSDWLTQGPAVPAFEQAVINQCGAKFAVAVNSATSALEIACHALGLKKGGLLWTVPNTFVASANCGRRCDADIDFIDIDPDTHNLSINELRKKLKNAKENNRLPDIVVAVHFAGHSCEMESLYTLSRQYGFRIIEDAAHAIGGFYKDVPVGSCRWSDITVFSFHPVKIITSGEGGMAVTNDPDLAHRMQLFRNNGITKDPDLFEYQSPNGLYDGWYYEQQSLGANYRMTDIQAALAISQLSRIKGFIQRRREIVDIYQAAFSQIKPLTLPIEKADIKSAWHLYPVKVNGTPEDHRNFYNTLQSEGLRVQVHYLPVHLHPYYRRQGFCEGDFPVSENYSARAVSLPLYHSMEDETVQTVIEIVKRTCKNILEA